MDSNINYEEKYIKYKRKYLELKQELEGGKGGKGGKPKPKASASKAKPPKKEKEKKKKEEKEEKEEGQKKKNMIKNVLKMLLNNNKMNAPDIFYQKFDESKDINDFINIISKDKDLKKLPNIKQIKQLIESNKTNMFPIAL